MSTEQHTIATKICTKCKNGLPETTAYFRKHHGGHHGLSSQCKWCEAKAARLWSATHKSERNARRRAFYAIHYAKPIKSLSITTKVCTKCYQEFPATTAFFIKRIDGYLGLQSICKKCKSIYRHAYFQQNTIKIQTSRHAYLEREKDHVAASRRRYRQEHPEIDRSSQQRRRSCKNGATVNDFTHAQWVVMQEHYEHRCVYCGKRRRGKLTQDHITPISKGGNHTVSNIVPACQSCNSKKRVGPPLVSVQPLLFIFA